MEGRIVKLVSGDYFVCCNKKIYVCKALGIFRYKNIEPKVGDYVKINEKDKVIIEVKDRFNNLDRPCVANVTNAFIVTSLKTPDFSLNLLDKQLLICELNNIKPVIIITKKDLVSKDTLRSVKQILKYYKRIGYKVLYNTNILRIKFLLRGKTIVFTGQTGAGKSTLLNKLDKNLNFEVGDVSKALGRGKHTTRYTSLVNICHGYVIDTPGFSDISLAKYSKYDIRNAMREFRNYKCPYKDCLHEKEDECLLKRDVVTFILKSRYDNYIKFISGLK